MKDVFVYLPGNQLHFRFHASAILTQVQVSVNCCVFKVKTGPTLKDNKQILNIIYY